MSRMLISVARDALQAVRNAKDPLLPDPLGWSNVARIGDTATGIRGYAAVNDGTLRIAFHGVDTFGGTWGAAYTNATTVLDGQVPIAQFQRLKQFLDGLVDRIDPSRPLDQNSLPGIAKIEVVGHSAGGALEEFSLAYLLDSRSGVHPWIPDVSGVSLNGVGIAHLWPDLQSQLGLTNVTPADVAANNRAFRVGIDPIAPWQPHFGDLEWLDKPEGFLGWFRTLISKVPLAGFLVGVFTDHWLERGLTELAKISDSTTLPIVALSDFNHSSEDIALARSGFEKYVDSEQVPFDSSTGAVSLPDGKLYVLIPAQDGEAARLYSTPVDSVQESGVVSGTRDGRLNLYAAPGTLDRIQSRADGGVELVLRAAPGSEAQSIVWKPDGSGAVEAEVRGILEGWGFAAGDQLVLISTASAESLKGGDGRDVIIAGAGDDQVTAGAGNDWIWADAGDDSIDAGPGNDSVYGGSGNDVIYGGEGDDFLLGWSGNNRIYGGDGDDGLVTGDGGESWLFGGPGDDGYTVGTGIAHIRDDDHVVDLCHPDDTSSCGDHLQFTAGVTPNDVTVTWQDRNLILRVFGGGGGTIWIDDGLDDWDDDDDDHVIEYFEFDDGTVWTWVEALKRAEPLPPGDPLGDSGPPPDIFPPMIRDLLHGGAAAGTSMLEDIVQTFSDSIAIISPIVLDLDGDGVETRSVDAGAHFDHDRNGFGERSGWVGSGDGLLVWDRNGDGRITDGIELFGSQTPLPDGVTPAANGFAALAAWDGNGDGKIDANDPIWSQLRIWRDADSDGVSTPEEIASTPGDLGIVAINTAYTTGTTVDAAGNEHRQIGSFTRADGTTGSAEDVWFKRDPVRSVAPDTVPVPVDVALLPTLPGYGTVYSLRQAMARDTSGTLKGLVAAFVAEANPAQRDLLMEQILFRWTGADGVDPFSRGNLIDARQLVALEAFMGQGYVGSDGSLNPHHQSAPLLQQAYARLKDWIYAQLDIQTHLADLYRLIPFSWDAARGLVGDLAPVKAELEARLAADPVAGQRDLSEFARSIRALKTEEMLSFGAFRDAFVAQDPSLAWLNDSGGPYLVEGGAGNDWLVGAELGQLMIGDAGNDFMYGQGGNDTLFGGAGNDQLRGGDGADTFDGGGGNDYAEGGPGGDTYLFGRGSGSLTIRDGDATPGVIDTIQLGPGILPADVRVWRQYDDLALTLNGSADSLSIQYFFMSDAPDFQIERIRFADGTVWDAAALKQMVLTGTDATDTLTGYATDDTLRGLGGSDWMYGRDGNDTLDGGPGNDYMWGEAGNDTLLGGPGNDQLYGGAGADTINGGGGGSDYAEGGAGGDTYIFDRGLGTLTLRDLDATAGVIDTIQLGPGVLPTDVTIWRNGDHLNLKINDTGDTLGVLYFFWQDLPDNQIERIRFADGTVWDLATIKQKVLTGTAGADTLIGYSTADTLQGLDGNDALWGRAGDDRLDGGAGADTMYGEAGNDTYVVDSTADVVTENTGEGTDTVESSITYSLPANVENLTLTGNAPLNGTGNALDNVLTGNSAANVLTGGAGNDTYIVGAGDTVVENLNEGTDTVLSALTYTLPSNVENLLLTGTAAINGTGNSLNNALTGNAAANVLSGGTGADTMAGAAGDDTYVVDNAGDVVTENPAEGTDTVQSSVTYTLAANVENLTLTGSAAINGTGNALANTLTGNSAANVLTGGAGDDTYVVGTGDTVVENAGEGTDTVQSSITYALPANVENLVLTGSSAISGTGNALNNSLTGNAAANTLNGGAGADTMAGGAGNDTYVVDNAGDVVTEAASAGTDTVQSSITYTLPANVENLTLTGSAAINGTGNALANTLTGNSAANVLVGGVGNDTYVVDNPGDVVIENAGEGTDTVQSSITYTLPANVENLTLTGSAAINGTGNALANTLTGNSAANALAGGAGNDIYVVGAGDSVVENPGEGTDTVQSSVTYALDANVENLTLTGTAAINGTGNALNNSLTGNAAANTLDGGAGADTLTGGKGNDTYFFNPGWGQDTIVENDVTAGNTDTVLFGGSLRPLDLVLSRAVNNLAITRHGSTDKATVQSWYSGAAYQAEVIQAGDGSRLLSTQVDLLIQAMASYSAQTGLTWDQAIDQRPQEVEAVLAGYWQHP
jgi:Ca2+-binding RTX toxin-like protein